MQTVPQAIGMLGTPEGRSQFLTGIEKFPADLAKGLVDFFKTPGTATKQGLTPEQEIEFGFNAALGRIGGSEFKVPSEISKAIAPIAKSFDDTVMAPAAERTVADEAAKTQAASANAPVVSEGASPTSEAVPKASEPQTPNLLRTIQEAKDFDIIGPNAPENPPPVVEHPDTPAEAAFRAYPVGSGVTPEQMRESPVGHAPGEYDVRGREWIDKIDAPDNVRDAIEGIASQYDYFPEARGGVASPQARAAVAEAAGIDPSEINSGYFGEHFDNDGKVRAVIQALRQTSGDFAKASEQARLNPNDDTAGAALEAELRAQHVIEYAIGKRAESGRSLAAWKDLLRETERARATPKLQVGEATGEVPTGTSDLINAARDVQSNLGKSGTQKLGLQKLIDAAERLANEPRKSVEGKPLAPLAPDLAGLVDAARDAMKGLKGDRTPSQLQKLIDAAERQAANMTKQPMAGRKPIEALPPELQNLVDKADRVTKRFGGIAKGEERAMLLAQSGRTAAEQAELARQVQGLTPNQIARVLQRLRNNPRPGWYFWLVQQALISGLITHTKYAFVNTAQTFLDRVIAPEMAAIGGRLRGEKTSLLAPVRAGVELFRAVPDALSGAKQAFKTGTRVPLQSELRLAERGEPNPEAAGAQVPYGQQQGPNWGVWRRAFSDDKLDAAAKVLGIPGRSANAIHTIFKIMNERAAAGQRAFEAAELEGNKIGSDKFWDRYQHHLDNPTDEVLKQNVEDAYSGTFMEKLGPKTQALAHLIRSTPFKWLVFFTHIPMNMVRRSIEYSPLAMLNMLGDTRMGSALKGELGQPAQNLAFAKMTVGAGVGAYFIQKALSGQATGDYPTDPKERRRWAIEGIQPNSIQANGQWLSLERLGPPAMVARIAANFASVIQHYDGSDDDALMKASLATVLGTANTLATDVGFETIKNLVDVLENPREAARFAAWQVSTYIMPASFVTQAASFQDPYMREANTLIDGLKYRLPGARETLLPKRDPLYGEPVQNPGYHDILRESPIQNGDPVKAEMDRLGYYPMAPKKTIGGVKLTPEQYDKYEATAGPLVRQALTALVRTPGWANVPAEARKATMAATIEAMRQRAAAAMQMDEPELVRQGLQRRLGQITGQP